MARITPHFMTSHDGETYRHAEEVPAEFGPWFVAHSLTGEVSAPLTITDKAGNPRVYVRLTYAEAESLGRWAEDCRKCKPLPYELKPRIYLIDGAHTVAVYGWWNGPDWEPDTTRPPLCESCALSAATVRALYAMARSDGKAWTVDGQSIVWQA